jgi:hypothetical protein
VEERLNYLFSPERIEERFALFEHVTLPSIRNQTDPDFTLVVVTSSAIPEPYLQRLYNLIEDIPQIALVLKEPENHRRAMRQVMRPYKDPDCDVIAQFRLDDDDAVAIDFVARAKSAFTTCQAEFDKAGKCALDFNQGDILHFGQNQCFGEQKQVKQATAGLVVYTRPQHPKTVINYAHYRITDFMPLIVDTTPDMFVRSLNSFNDSPKARALPVPDEPILDEVAEVLDRRFRISIPNLLNAHRP